MRRLHLSFSAPGFKLGIEHETENDLEWTFFSTSIPTVELFDDEAFDRAFRAAELLRDHGFGFRVIRQGQITSIRMRFTQLPPVRLIPSPESPTSQVTILGLKKAEDGGM